MSRKSDEELLEEIKAKRKVKEAEEEVENLRDEEENSDDVPDMNKQGKVPTQIIEREINLAFINDKLNFIISKLQQPEK